MCVWGDEEVHGAVQPPGDGGGVWVGGAGGAQIGSSSGMFLSYDAGTWSTVGSVFRQITSIWGTAADDVWYVLKPKEAVPRSFVGKRMMFDHRSKLERFFENLLARVLRGEDVEMEMGILLVVVALVLLLLAQPMVVIMVEVVAVTAVAIRRV